MFDLYGMLLISFKILLYNIYALTEQVLQVFVVCERLTRTRVASERTLHFFTSVSCVDQHPRITRHVASHNNQSLKGTVTTI